MSRISFSRTLSAGLVALCLPVCVFAQPGPPGGSPPGAPVPAALTVTVDCDAGGSLAAALAERADELTVEFRGTCAEHVAIERDRTTLRGLDATAAIIGPASTPSRPALRVTGASRVTLEELAVTDADSTAVLVERGAAVEARTLTVNAAARHGLLVIESSFAHVAASSFDGNGADGLGIWQQSSATLEGAIRAGGNGRAGLIVSGSSLSPVSFGTASLSLDDNLVGLVSQSQADVGFGRLDPLPVTADRNLIGAWAAAGQLSLQHFAATDNQIGVLATDAGYLAMGGFRGEIELSGNDFAGLSAADDSTVLVDGVLEADGNGVFGLLIEGGEARLAGATAAANGAVDLSLAFGVAVSFGSGNAFGSIDCDGTVLTRGPQSCPGTASAAARDAAKASVAVDLPPVPFLLEPREP